MAWPKLLLNKGDLYAGDLLAQRYDNDIADDDDGDDGVVDIIRAAWCKGVRDYRSALKSNILYFQTSLSCLV